MVYEILRESSPKFSIIIASIITVTLLGSTFASAQQSLIVETQHPSIKSYHDHFVVGGEVVEMAGIDSIETGFYYRNVGEMDWHRHVVEEERRSSGTFSDPIHEKVFSNSTYEYKAYSKTQIDGEIMEVEGNVETVKTEVEPPEVNAFKTIETGESYAVVEGHLLGTGDLKEADVYVYWRKKGEDGWNNEYINTWSEDDFEERYISFRYEITDLESGKYEWTVYGEAEYDGDIYSHLRGENEHEEYKSFELGHKISPVLLGLVSALVILLVAIITLYKRYGETN